MERFSLRTLFNDTHIISFSVEDEVGAVCVSQIILSVGNAPEVEILNQQIMLFSIGEIFHLRVQFLTLMSQPMFFS